MKKVKEIITLDNGFFQVFKTQNATEYSSILSDTDPKHLDRTLLILGGERYASPLIKEYNIEDVVSYIVINNYSKWLKFKEVLELKYNVVNPHEHKTTTTQEKSGENINTFQESEKTAVHTFDSVEATDKDIDTTENTDKTTATENVKVVVETSGNNGNIPITKLISDELDLRQKQFINIIVKDVLKEISLDIY